MNLRTIHLILISLLILVLSSSCGNNDDDTSKKGNTGNVTTTDTQAPTFTGATTATQAGAFAIDVTWSAASDNVSAASSIQYNVYLRKSTDAINFSTPYSSIVGSTTIRLKNLSRGTAYIVVARAQDDAGNEDTNSIERPVMTNATPTLSFDVQPIFNAACVDCHQSPTAEKGLDLSSGAAYSKTVNQICSVSGQLIIPNDAANSQLALALSGSSTCVSKMPPGASLSASDISIVTDWINAGALNN